MSVLDFDSLKVTTMTVIVKLTGTAHIEYIFPLLDFTRIQLPDNIKQTKKFKIPFCGIPGAILSAKFKDTTRGIVKSKSGKFFRNSITIDLCTSKKNIVAKLSRHKIHMTGADSEELAIEAANHILDHIKTIQADLDYMAAHPESQETTIAWIKDNSKGEYFIIDAENHEILTLGPEEKLVQSETAGIYHIITAEGKVKTKNIEHLFDAWHADDYVDDDKVIRNVDNKPYYMYNGNDTDHLVSCILEQNFFIKPETYDEDGNITGYIFRNIYDKPVKIITQQILEVAEVHSLLIPSGYPNTYPEDIDKRIANFYIRQAPDYAYHHVFCQYIDCVKAIKEVMTSDLNVERLNMAMINYSYSLGMSIDRWQLANWINGRNGFSVRYNNTTDHCVTISLPYEIPDDMKLVRRKNKTPRHTFMVYKSGIVTQSGPNIQMMKEAYRIFIQTIMDIKDVICVEGKSFNLKYIPVKVNS